MDEKKRTLDDEIQDIILSMENFGPATEEYAKMAQNLETLYRLKLEEEKTNSDKKDSLTKKEVVGYILEGAGIILPLVFYGIWMRKGFKFEETGCYTSKTFGNLQHFFKPKK